MAVYTADAEKIIKEEKVRKERRARKKQKKIERKQSRKKNRRREDLTTQEKSESKISRVKKSEPKENLTNIREIREPLSPVKNSQSSMQEASVSPISATVSSAREEQHAVALTEPSPRPKYPRKRISVASPDHASVQVTTPSPNEGKKTSVKVINAVAKKKAPNVAVDRHDGAALSMNSNKLHHTEFHEATVLVTSLAHLHQNAKRHHVDAAPAKTEEKPSQQKIQLAKVRNRANLLSKASKAW